MPIPIYLVNETDIQTHHSTHQAWLTASRFRGEPYTFCLIPGENGHVAKVLVGKPDPVDTWSLGSLPQSLPAQEYYLADDWPPAIATKLLLGWRLGAYRFTRYKQADDQPIAKLQIPAGADAAYVDSAIAGTFLARDLINTPAGDMGPEDLEAAVQTLADSHTAELKVIRGDELLSQNFPLIHAVGRAYAQAPRLLDLTWGNPNHPKVALVGKGVCFDTGGLNIKNTAGIKLMKKDMGGAANVLGLAAMIMGLRLPVRLRVLIPAVENSISSNAVHPVRCFTLPTGADCRSGQYRC